MEGQTLLEHTLKKQDNSSREGLRIEACTLKGMGVESNEGCLKRLEKQHVALQGPPPLPSVKVTTPLSPPQVLYLGKNNLRGFWGAPGRKRAGVRIECKSAYRAARFVSTSPHPVLHRQQLGLSFPNSRLETLFL